MNDIIELNDEQKSEVKEIWRMYKRGKWYSSDTALYGYEKYYYATKVRIRLYYKDRESAENEAEKYNKRRAAYEKGQIPKYIEYDMFEGTEVTQENIWPHSHGNWLYEHTFWNGAYLDELLNDDMDYKWDDKHSTRDFFEVMFTLKKFMKYKLVKDNEGNYKLQKRSDA